MPELPEVEIVALNLRDWLVGKKIVQAKIIDDRLIKNSKASTLSTELKDKTCISVERRAKYLILKFKEAKTVVAHLGMTGKFVKLQKNEELQYSRMLFCLRKEQRISFKDSRRFGKIWLLSDSEIQSLPELASLGPDPLLKGVDFHYLKSALGRTRRPIKVVLMDQTIIGGLGNILANEILFRAGISPFKPSNSLFPKEVTTLNHLIPAICKEIIDREQAREVRYLGEIGAVNHFQVYLREKEPCPQCQTLIRRVTLAQRGTFFCHKCQKVNLESLMR